MSNITPQWVKINPFEAANRLTELERENASLRADKERLDWIARNRSVSAAERPCSVTPESLRESIDAARKVNP